jgi:hypothetical protein
VGIALRDYGPVMEIDDLPLKVVAVADCGDVECTPLARHKNKELVAVGGSLLSGT